MKKSLLVIVVMLVFASGAFAQVPAKPFNIYAGGGLTMPSSPDAFKDGFKMGFHGTAKLGLKAVPKGEILLNLEYHMFGLDNEDMYGTNVDGGDLSIIMAGADYKLNLGVPLAPVNPFIQAGGGLAIISMSDLSYTDPVLGDIDVTTESINKIYLEIGGGIEFNKFFASIRIVNIFNGSTEYDVSAMEVKEKSALMIPLTVGVKF